MIRLGPRVEVLEELVQVAAERVQQRPFGLKHPNAEATTSPGTCRMHAPRLGKYDFNSGRAMPSGLSRGLPSIPCASYAACASGAK